MYADGVCTVGGGTQRTAGLEGAMTDNEELVVQ